MPKKIEKEVQDVDFEEIKDDNKTSSETSETKFKPPVKKVEEPKVEQKGEQKPDPNLVGSKEIDTDKYKKAGKEKTTLNFTKSSSFSQFMKQPTRDAEEEKHEDRRSPQSAEEARKQIIEEENKTDNLTVEDFADIAETVVDVIDSVFSSILRWYAKDTSDAAYSLTEAKKKRLSRQMTKLLVKYQAKFKIEFLFILTLLAVYASPAMKAKENREAVNKRLAEEKRRKKKEEESQDENSNSSSSSEYVEFEEVKDDDKENKTETRQPFRKRGKPSKA